MDREQRDWWIKAERRADEELKSGRYQEFNSVEDLIADLHSAPVFTCPWCKLVFYPESATDMHCIGGR